MDKIEQIYTPGDIVAQMCIFSEFKIIIMVLIFF